MLRIQEVKSKSDLKKFVGFPLTLYKDNKCYVPSFFADEMGLLNPAKNPSLACCKFKCWIALQDDKVVGRIGGIIQHQDNEINKRKRIRFTRIDFVEDEKVAHALLDTVANWGLEMGMDTMHGPWGFNDQDREGMLTFGFDQRSTFCTNYSFSYYVDFINSYGLKEECEWVEYRFGMEHEENDRILKVARLVKDRLHLREIADSLTGADIAFKWGKKIFELIDATYKDLVSYVPVTGAVAEGILASFAPIIVPKYTSLVVNDADELIAFSIAIPCIADAVRTSKGRMLPFGWAKILKAKHHPKELEWLLIAVRPDYQTRGLNAWLLSRIGSNALHNGVTRIDSDCMLTTNTEVLSQLSTLPHELVRRRKCFVKAMTDPKKAD